MIKVAIIVVIATAIRHPLYSVSYDQDSPPSALMSKSNVLVEAGPFNTE